jgi:hypothetical protein
MKFEIIPNEDDDNDRYKHFVVFWRKGTEYGGVKVSGDIRLWRVIEAYKDYLFEKDTEEKENGTKSE